MSVSKCLDCNKDFEKEFNDNLTKIFENVHRFCDGSFKNMLEHRSPIDDIFGNPDIC